MVMGSLVLLFLCNGFLSFLFVRFIKKLQPVRGARGSVLVTIGYVVLCLFVAVLVVQMVKFWDIWI